MTDNNRKGSVIVMVVGLLVLLAMVGMTFIIVAHMDRRESASIATVAPMKQVAGGVLQQIRAKLAADLYISSGDVIYGDATNYKEQVDFPHEDYDKHLASFGPVDTNGDGVVDTWKHISNHNDVGVFANVAVDDALLVDTDGYSWGGNEGDAKLFSSGVSNRSGKQYYVAYRLIDASSLMNANSAYATLSAKAGRVMPVTDVSLSALAGVTARNEVHAVRRGDTGVNITDYNTHYVLRPLNPNPPGGTAFLPFDASDMLAVVWGRTIPNTASGRLYEALGTYAQSPTDRRPYLTVHSASRDYVRQVSGGVNEPMTDNRRVGLNTAAFVDLFNAFYNAIPVNPDAFPLDDNARRMVAAQLAVNVIDYRDTDNDVTVQDVYDAIPAKIGTVFGVERQPFITEAWLRMEWVGDAATGSVQQWSAIELFNPYKTQVDLTGYKLKVGGNTNDLQNNPGSIPAGERIVIVSNTADIQALSKSQDDNLDLREPCTLFRQSSSDAAGVSSVPVGSVGIGDFVDLDLDEPNAGDPPVYAAIRRDDAVARAKYSVAVYKTYGGNTVTYLIGETGCPTATLTNLGRSNVDPLVGGEATVTTTPAAAPTPVFVRNGNLINLGEVSRIFYKGPSDSDPLDNVLASMSPNNVSNGRLYTLGAITPGGWTVTNANIPDVPPICMLGDYMDVLTPSTDNDVRTDTVYGRININTAPWQVIQYLPGISAMAQRDLIATDIVAYRDLLDNTSTGGTDYSAGARAAILTDLRDAPGFASPGEVAIPIYLRGSKADIAAGYKLPQNNYSATDESPYNYTLAGTADDGLDEITGDLSKYDIYYSWMSNQLTVRSDVYIAYIRVQIGSSATTAGAVRRYIAVIDRSNCTSTDKLPDVLMFAEMK